MRPIRSLASAFVGILAVCAQVQGASLRILAWDDGIAGRKLSLSTSKGAEELKDLNPLQRTKSYPIGEGTAPIQVIAQDKNGADGKPLVLSVPAQPALKQPLLLLMPDPKAPTGLRPFLLEDDTSSFSWGSIRLINATGKKLIFQYEKKAKAVPGTFTPLEISPGGENRNMSIRISAESNPAQALYSAVWEQNNDLRSLIFIIPGEDPRQGPLGFKIIPESKIGAAAEAAAGKGNKPQ